jgi:hypothetical protein
VAHSDECHLVACHSGVILKYVILASVTLKYYILVSVILKYAIIMRVILLCVNLPSDILPSGILSSNILIAERRTDDYNYAMPFIVCHSAGWHFKNGNSVEWHSGEGL